MSRCFRSPRSEDPARRPARTTTIGPTTAEAVIKRGAAHYHEHHCGPESIIPEIEAAIRRGIVEA